MKVDKDKPYGVLNPNQTIIPKPIHSHNDYWRLEPVFDAINVGCLSIEADVWLLDGELIVSHDGISKSSFDKLYIDRLLYLVDTFAPSAHGPQDGEKFKGIYTCDTGYSLQFVIDVKTEPTETWKAVQKSLKPLRDRNLLSTWKMGTSGVGDSNQRYPSPWVVPDKSLNDVGITRSVFTVVATGNFKPDLLLSMQERDFFVDISPGDIDALPKEFSSDGEPNKAVVDYLRLYPYVIGPMISASARKYPYKNYHYRYLHQVKNTDKLAKRMWDTVPWPISRRNQEWAQLRFDGYEWLNADDLVAAAEF